jgi:hypothetical protein
VIGGSIGSNQSAAGRMTARGAWRSLSPGDKLMIVKISHAGEAVATYPGKVFSLHSKGTWVGATADWVAGNFSIDGLPFTVGDRLHEYFSPEHSFNVFAIFSPSGVLRGWYANVTFPSWMDAKTDPPTLYWHDLYVDLIGLPDGSHTVRDEDELNESGLKEADPELYALILSARDELIRRFQAREYPFHDR